MPSFINLLLGILAIGASTAGLVWLRAQKNARGQTKGTTYDPRLDRYIGFSTLQSYILAETIPPILLSILALTFFLLVRVIYRLTDLLLAGGSSLVVIEMLATSLPDILKLTVPTAILLGVLLGVGRMAVENEIRACQTAGVNLARVFWPLILCCATLSVAMITLSYEITPRLVQRRNQLKTELTYQALRSIPPGITTDEYKMDRNRTTFYYSARDPETGDLLGVCMLIESKTRTSGSPSDPSRPSEPEKKPDDAGTGDASRARAPSRVAWAAEPEGAPGLTVEAPADEKDRQEADGALGTPEPPPTASRPKSSSRHELILAARGRIEADRKHGLVSIRLLHGSIHPLGEDIEDAWLTDELAAWAEGRLRPEGQGPVAPSVERDQVVRFDGLSKTVDFGERLAPRDRPVEYTMGQMVAAFRQGPDWGMWQGRNPNYIASRKRDLMVEWASRTSVPLACLSFALLAIPLAIFIRPSGKSVGAAIAFGLILIYYWMIKWGDSMAREGADIGFFVIFLPNLLMAGLGLVLFRRAIRM